MKASARILGHTGSTSLLLLALGLLLLLLPLRGE
jgi:hypothetical protein